MKRTPSFLGLFALALAAALAAEALPAQFPQDFVRGDTHGDGVPDVSDAIYTLNFLFLGALAPPCLDAADANDDGTVDISDPVFALGFLFYGEREIPPPFPHCGPDPTPDALDCRRFSACSFIPISEVWSRRFGSRSCWEDSARAVAIDPAGNTIVTGASGSMGWPDYATLKYDADGNRLWVARYDGPRQGTDEPHALAVDRDGNVLVTGTSDGPDTPNVFDYVTVKYDPAGREMWVRRYDGLDKKNDIPRDIGTDAARNVYVTGVSIVEDSVGDMATVKYSPDGEELWVRRFQGPSHGASDGHALAVDPEGGVYVAGVTKNSDLREYESVVVRYGSDGGEIWVAFRLSTGFGAVDVAADPGGGALVLAHYPVGDSADMLTLKYGADGEERWARAWGRPETGEAFPVALAALPSGETVVLGRTGPTYASDVAIAKYGPGGEDLWARTYDEGGDEEVMSLAVDEAGSIYVTGSSSSLENPADFFLLKSGPDGVGLWTRRYRGPAGSGSARSDVAVNRAGNVSVVGTLAFEETCRDMTLLSFAADGSERWLRTYAGLEWYVEDWPAAMALGRDGSFYATGFSGPYWARDYLTLKYSPDGDLLWQARHDAGLSDNPEDIALDDEGNAYVVGSSEGDYGFEFSTVKYSPEGALLWEARYSTQFGDDGARAVALDGSGNIFVTGYSQEEHGWDYATLKYSPSGEELWVRTYDGPGVFDWNDEPLALVVDTGGSPIVTGASSGPDSIDVATVKYSSDGAELWVRRYGGLAGGQDVGRALAVDGEGNILVAGGSEGTSGDGLTLKYSPGGAEQWARRYDGPDGQLDSFSGIAADADRNVIVWGVSIGKLTALDALVAKYSPAGDELWARRYSGPSSLDDWVAAVALGPGGYLYAAVREGREEGARTVVLRYAAEGGLEAAFTVEETEGWTSPAAIEVDRLGMIYLLAGSWPPERLGDFLLAKYRPGL